MRAKAFIYRHRHGIMGTVIFHLLLGIVLLCVGISRVRIHREAEFELDMPSPELVEQKMKEKQRVEEIRRQVADEEVEQMLRSIAVNENVAQNGQRHDVEDIQQYIKDIQEELSGSYGNRYQVKKNKHHRADSLQYAKDEQQRRLDSLQATVYVGKSSVSYKIGNRYKLFLPIPVFKCEFGGQVVVSVVVNAKGNIVRAEVVDKDSKQDECLREVAVDAALRSRFNPDKGAPDRQVGTITYHFVKQ